MFPKRVKPLGVTLFSANNRTKFDPRSKTKSPGALMRNDQCRKAKGIMFAEVAFGAITAIAVAAIAVDITILTYGFSVLDIATRDCARAAGSQSSQATAFQAAQAQLSVHQTDGTFIQQPFLLPAPIFAYVDPPSPPATDPDATPYVDVTCEEKIKLPVYIPFYGLNIKSSADANGYLLLRREYRFPIVKTAPPGG